MTGDVLIGVDIGTSSTKGVACSPSGEVLAEARMEHRPSVPRPGWMEADAEHTWWREFCQVARKLSGSLPGSIRVRGLAVSSLAPCLVPVDAAGRPVRPAILHGPDTRAAEQAKALTDRCGRAALEALGVARLTSQSIGPKILWLRENEPEVFARTAQFLTTGGYILSKLCGVRVVDRHVASFFAPFIDVRRGCWDLRFADGIVESSQLPDLVWSSEVVGELDPGAARECGLAPGTPIAAGSADGLLDALMGGLGEPGRIAINYGSSMNVIATAERDAATGGMWFAAGLIPGSHIVSGGVLAAGSVASWFVRELAREHRYGTPDEVTAAHLALTREAEASHSSAEPLLMLPHFGGRDTPDWDPGARGVIAGLSLATTRGDLYRAALQGAGFALRENIERIVGSGTRMTAASALGGGAATRFWPQIVSDITGIPQDLPAWSGGAARGAAYLSGLAQGLLGAEDLAARWVRFSARVEPDPSSSDRYQALYEQSLRLQRETGALVTHDG